MSKGCYKFPNAAHFPVQSPSSETLPTRAFFFFYQSPETMEYPVFLVGSLLKKREIARAEVVNFRFFFPKSWIQIDL